jgi:hypothetical protein
MTAFLPKFYDKVRFFIEIKKMFKDMNCFE